MSVKSMLETLGGGSASGKVSTDGQPTGPDNSGGEAVPTLVDLASQAKKAGRKSRNISKGIDADRARIEASQEIEELFQQEQWEEIASWYFDLRYVMTSWEGFRLTPQENSKLGLTFAKTMKVLLKINPEYIAMILFFGNFSSLITKKEARYYHLRKAAEAQEELKRRNLPIPPKVSP